MQKEGAVWCYQVLELYKDRSQTRSIRAAGEAGVLGEEEELYKLRGWRTVLKCPLGCSVFL